MKEKNIEFSIVNQTKFSIGTIPLDARLIKGKEHIAKNSSPKKQKVIEVQELNYNGSIRKTPYSPISSIYSQELLVK